MEGILTVIYTVLAVQNHTPSINELDASEYYGRDVRELDYQICDVEVPIDHPYLEWELIPNTEDITYALEQYDSRMEREHRASAYLYTAGSVVSVLKVRRGKGDWSSQDTDDRRNGGRGPKAKEMWVMPGGEEIMNSLLSREARHMRNLIEHVEEEETEE